MFTYLPQASNRPRRNKKANLLPISETHTHYLLKLHTHKIQFEKHRGQTGYIYGSPILRTLAS
jgi:hypothetical protein